MHRRDRSFLHEHNENQEGYGSIHQTDYPAATNKIYQQRKQDLVQLGRDAWPLIPHYEYLPEEHQTWQYLYERLIPLQDKHSCRDFLEGRTRLIDHQVVMADQIPQLDKISSILESHTGMMLAPVGGLLESPVFLSFLAHQVMRSTAYVRHASHPQFTPEPDIIHEILGHSPMFMLPTFVDFSTQIGLAAQYTYQVKQGMEKLAQRSPLQEEALQQSEELIRKLSLLYWYTFEYGLMYESNTVKIFGAGSNAGLQDLKRSIDASKHKQLSDEIYRYTIDYDAPQDVFYVADSYEHIVDMAAVLRKQSEALKHDFL